MGTVSATTNEVAEYCLRIGDDRLILGHRLSEWCGHGPILEEDIALANIALDLLGQANRALELAAESDGTGRSADSLAFFREAIEFRNALLTELPRGDFAYTIARQFFFDAYSVYLMDALQASKHEGLAALAAKAVKEERYHLRHSGDWMVKLGDGTEESHARLQAAVNELWRFTRELFESDDVVAGLVRDGVAVDPASLKPKWDAVVSDVLVRATLEKPTEDYFVSGGRHGRHTEHLGHLLAEMQIVARSHPGVQW